MNEKSNGLLTPEHARFLLEAMYMYEDETGVEVMKRGADLTREEIERALAQTEATLHELLDEFKQYPVPVHSEI